MNNMLRAASKPNSFYLTKKADVEDPFSKWGGDGSQRGNSINRIDPKKQKEKDDYNKYKIASEGHNKEIGECIAKSGLVYDFVSNRSKSGREKQYKILHKNGDETGNIYQYTIRSKTYPSTETYNGLKTVINVFGNIVMHLNKIFPENKFIIEGGEKIDFFQEPRDYAKEFNSAI